MAASPQLAFDFPAEPRFEPEDFLVSGSNETAFAAIESWPAWSDSIMLVLGPAGSGKSHLAAVFAARAHAWILNGRDVTAERVEHLSSTGALAVEIAPEAAIDEAAWFHLLNRVRQRRGAMLVTARTPPESWGLGIADLLSRLRQAPRVAMAPPDDPLLRAVLVKLFLDRQIMVDTRVVDLLVARCERSVPALAAAVDLLDRAALAGKRRLTPGFAASILSAAEAAGSTA